MSDSKKILNCPACGKEMKKIELQDYGFCVDICLDGCGSIVFDNREFQKFDEKNENIEPILAAYEKKGFPQTESEDILICPVCNTKMVKNIADTINSCKIDECYNCGVRFLNYGELLKIRENSDKTSPKYLKDVQLVINQNEILREQNEKNKSLYRKVYEMLSKSFKKY